MKANTAAIPRIDRRTLLIHIVVAVAAVALVLYQTRLGPGAGGDSIRYVMGAETLLAGEGYSRIAGGGTTKPETGFPPFFSIVLLGFGLTGVDYYEGARVLHALIFGVNLLLSMTLVHRYTRSLIGSAIAGLLLLTAPNLLGIHTWVMSEPIYLLLTLAGIYGLLRYLETGARSALIFTGVVISLSVLTRFVGLSLVFAGVLAIWLFSAKPLRTRILDGLILGAISVAPMGLWMVRNSVVGGSATNREIRFHVIRTDLLSAYLREGVSWFVPFEIDVPKAVRASAAVLLAASAPILFTYRDIRARIRSGNGSRDGLAALPWILFLYCVGYVMMLMANSFLFDAATTLGAARRYLTPLFMFVILLVVVTTYDLIRRIERPLFLGSAAAVLAGILVLLYARQTLDLIQNPISHMGKISLRVTQPGLSEALSLVDESVPIVTDNPEFVYLLSGRGAFMRPIRYDAYKQEFRDDFDQQVDATRERLTDGGVYVLFDNRDQDEIDLVELLGAVPLNTFAQVSLYVYP